jgi:hypothetical protein
MSGTCKLAPWPPSGIDSDFRQNGIASGRAAPAPTHWPSIASQIAHVLRPWPAYDRAESAPRVSPKRTRRPPPALLPPLLPLSPSFLHSRSLAAAAGPASMELRRKNNPRLPLCRRSQVQDSAPRRPALTFPQSAPQRQLLIRFHPFLRNLYHLLMG